MCGCRARVIPANLLIMMPYLLTIVVLIFARDRQRREPAALTNPLNEGKTELVDPSALAGDCKLD